jgi:hypothetical protein
MNFLNPRNKDWISSEQFLSQIHLDADAVAGQGEGRTGQDHEERGRLDNDGPRATADGLNNPYWHRRRVGRRLEVKLMRCLDP